MGPQTEALEEEFAQYVGARHALAVANGTAALHLVCVAAGLGPGDEVVVPSMTFVATVNAIAYTGATPVFADIHGLTEPWLSRAPSRPWPRRTPARSWPWRTAGIPARRRRSRSWHATAASLLLEDAAHAAGSRCGGRHLGTFGRAGAFSFFSNKNLAVGEGGMVVTDDDDARRADAAAALARDDDADLGPPPRPRVGLRRGRRSATTTASTSRARRSARRRLARLDAENGRRAELDARYRERCSTARAGLRSRSRPRPAARPADHLFTVVLDPDVDAGGVPGGARRARHPDERPLPAGAPPLGSRMRRRPARDGGVRRSHGHVAALRDDDRRPAGRGGERHSRGAHHPARRYRRTRAPILNVRLVLPAVTTTRSVRVARLR